MTTITIDRKLLEEVVEIFDNALSTRYPHEILRDIRATLAAPATAPEPMFWVRIRSDGMYEGPLHNAQIEKVRKESGSWRPLYLHPPASAPQKLDPTGSELPRKQAKQIELPSWGQDITIANMRERHAQELCAYQITVDKLRAERKPMTKGQREQVARRAEEAMNGNINLSWRDALMSEIESFHGIGDKI